MRRLVLSVLGTGFLRPAPGTWGSLVALPLAWALHVLAGPGNLVVATAFLYTLGLCLTEREIAEGGDSDPSWIVLDEVVGQWVALFPVSVGAYLTGARVLELWPEILAGFLLFRLFDIWKPWLVGRADRRGDATGVMMDDVWAGAFAALAVIALALLAQAGFGAAVPGRQ